MKTPAELMDDLSRVMSEMEDGAMAAYEYASLLSVLSTHDDAESVMGGIHRVTLEIRQHADNIRVKHDEAWQIMKRLRNPTLSIVA